MTRTRTTRPIERESWALAQLQREGWSYPDGNPAEVLRALARRGERLRRRWENECSYEWACTPEYERGTERAEEILRAEAARLGLTLYLQTDPRGAPVYVCGPAGEMTDRNYSTRGICLYFNT